MSAGLGRDLLAWLLGRLYRLLFAGLGLAFGLLWAWLGLAAALGVSALAALGYALGAWVDRGRPGGGLASRLRRYFDPR